MKRKHCFNRVVLTLTAVSTLIVAMSLHEGSLAQGQEPKMQERIGVYDSRSIAVAFAGSPAHEKQLQELMAEHKKAKKAGDRKKVAKLEAEGKARQVKAHTQAFSTAPVEDILAHISKSLPDIRKTAGVTALVSKWDETELKKYPGAETVDVTMRLVDAFQPNERQRKSAVEIQKHKPISLKQAERIRD